MEYLIDKLSAENKRILDNQRYLEMAGDFTEHGNKLYDNQVKIEMLERLPVKLRTGLCQCDNRIPRPQYEIKFCAWCHREIGLSK